MPWHDGAFAGFSTAEPWLPLNADWRTRNVAVQERDPSSMLNLYRRLLLLRRRHLALTIGDFTLLPSDPEILQYQRHEGDDRVLVALNFGGTKREIRLPADAVVAEALVSSLTGEPEYRGTLAAGEGLVLRLEQR